MHKVDLKQVAGTLGAERKTEIVARVNASRLRLARVDGEGPWGSHPHDEFAHVLSGRLFVRFADRTVELGPGEGVLVPRDVDHAAMSKEPTVILLTEPDS